MSWFSKKKDTQYIEEFNSALSEINNLAENFRDSHLESVKLFEANFQKAKGPEDFEKERRLFEKHLDTLQQLKLQTDLLIDEAFKIVRNETALTERDRKELKKIIQPAKKTSIKVKQKK